MKPTKDTYEVEVSLGFGEWYSKKFRSLDAAIKYAKAQKSGRVQLLRVTREIVRREMSIPKKVEWEGK